MLTDASAVAHGPLYAFQDMDLDPVSNNVESLQPANGENVQMELSLAVMDQETHTECLAIQEDVQSVKGTDTAYVRHLKIYEKFMEIDQAHHIMQNPAWKVVPAHPIKVAAFLEYKTKWLKVCASSVLIQVASHIFLLAYI